MTVTIHVGFNSQDFSQKSGKLFIADPAAQEGLVPVVAKGTKPVTYLNSYNVAEQVHCAFCDSHQRHNRGFTVGLEDGSIALCGNRCAEGYFGQETARALRADLERRQDRQKHLEKIASTFAGIKESSRYFSDTLVAFEQVGLDLILLLAQILPPNAQTKIRAGDVPGVNGRFLRLYQSSPLMPRIQGILRDLSGVMNRDCEMSDVVLRKSMDSRARLLGWIGELADFFTEMERFLSPENLWDLVKFHEGLPHDGSVIEFRPAFKGVDLYIFRPGKVAVRHRVGQKVAFDGPRILALLNGQGD